MGESSRKYFSQIWLHNTYEGRKKKKQNPSILNFGDLEFFNLKSSEFGPFFLMKNPFV
jgi:hypothetical protein